MNTLGTSGLDWGNLDTEIDNPLLDVDDTERGGPENIFIHRAGDRFYDVYVDYYDGVNETLPEIESGTAMSSPILCIIPRTYHVLLKVGYGMLPRFLSG